MQFSVKVYCLAYATRVIEADSAKAAAEAALSAKARPE